MPGDERVLAFAEFADHDVLPFDEGDARQVGLGQQHQRSTRTSLPSSLA